jgi:MazG family protein
MPSQIEALLRTIHTLRAPGGCPWDRKQSLAAAARYLLDEAGELLDATLTGDTAHIKEELADLLFMICFCTEILGETYPVSLGDIAREGNEKLIRRHPHVFGDREADNTAESQAHWNEIKAAEKKARGIDVGQESVLKELPSSSAPLHQAYSYGEDAAAVGFDWPDVAGVWDKLHEELEELHRATDSEAVEHELGDLLFATANLARHFGVQPDIALRKANQRFRRRFNHVEERFARDREKLKNATLDELEAAWVEAKKRTEPRSP